MKLNIPLESNSSEDCQRKCGEIHCKYSQDIKKPTIVVQENHRFESLKHALSSGFNNSFHTAFNKVVDV